MSDQTYSWKQVEVAGKTCRPLVWWRAATDEIVEMRQEVVLSRTDVVDRSRDTSRKTENFDASAIYLQCWHTFIHLTLTTSYF